MRGRGGEVVEQSAAEPAVLLEHPVPVSGLDFSLDDGAEAGSDPVSLKRGLDADISDASLFRDELEAAMQADENGALERRLARGLGVADAVEGNLLDLVRGLVQPPLVIGGGDAADQLVIFRPPDEEDVVRVMDRRQESLAKGLAEGHRVVRGVAGSGKTLVLVYRARLFAERYPDHRFLVTCFTRSLASQLRLLLRDYENIDVKHIDGLMRKAIGDAKLPHPTYGDDSTGEAVAATAVTALERGALPRYRAVFVDEAQDLGTTALVFARKLIDDRYDDLLVVADAAQNIFRRKFSWKQAGINAQGRTKILRVNYRNTREVLDLASWFLFAGDTLVQSENPDVDDETAVVPPKSAARSGPEPTVKVTRSGDLVPTAVRAVASLLGEKPVPKQVAVLYLGGDEGRKLAGALQQLGIDHFWVTDPTHKEHRDRIAETVAPVVLSTVHSAKGLEFDSVVLTCTPPDRELGVNELRMTLYVGMTRATQQLVVVAGSGHPLVDDLRKAAESSGRLVLGTDE